MGLKSKSCFCDRRCRFITQTSFRFNYDLFVTIWQQVDQCAGVTCCKWGKKGHSFLSTTLLNMSFNWNSIEEETMCRTNVKCNQAENHLTVTSLHQLGVAVLWGLLVDGGAGTLIFLCLDPIAAAAGAVGVARDVRWSRVVFCVWGRTWVSCSSLRELLSFKENRGQN